MLFRSGLITFRVQYPGGKRMVVRILGIPVSRIRIKKAKKSKKKSKKKSSKAKPKVVVERIPVTEKTIETKPLNKPQQVEKKNKDKKKIPKLNIRNKLSYLRNIKKYYNMIFDSQYKNAFSFLKDTGVRLLKHIRPSETYADLVIGTGDPCNTGFVFGMLGLLYVVWPGKYHIEPDFEQKIIQGNIKVKGSVLCVIFLYHMIRIMRNDDVKVMVKQANK